MPVTTSDLDILGHIKKSGLVSEAALQKFERAHPNLLGNPAAVVEEMIKQKLLTKFQGKHLLSGKNTTFILGSYKILEPIGKGGMGKIYLAEHTSLQRRVAIKVLPAEKAKDQELLKRFHREARAAAALDHPNIVKIYDVNQGGGTQYLVMEYVAGKTLQQIVTAQGPIPYQHALQYIIQTANGLQHAHDKGFIHRDIKPDNIILSKEGIVKILDMGLARSLHQEQDNVTKQMNPQAIYGSIDYISPEQSIGGVVDARSDIYSLGATLYAILSGEAPFSGTAAQVLMSHQFDNVPQVNRGSQAFPAVLNDVIARMMAKQADQRYRSAQEVKEVLMAIADGKTPPRNRTTVMMVPERTTVRMATPPTPPPTPAPVLEPAPPSKPKSKGSRSKKAKPRFTVTPAVALSVVGIALGIAALSIFLMSRSSNTSLYAMKPEHRVVDTSAKAPAPEVPNYVPPTLNDSDCVYLNLRPLANVISTKHLFVEKENPAYTDTITLAAWGRVRFNNVPFDAIDPKNKSVPNVLVFQGGDSAFTKSRPTSVIVPCHTKAKTIHFLGGISGWAYPFDKVKNVALIAKLKYQNGTVEEHRLINGVHFADWRMPQELIATAPLVVQYDNERHLRYFSITPKKQDEIKEIEFVKGDNKTAAPIFFAITIEKPGAVASNK